MIEIEVAKLENDSDALRRELARKDDLQEEIESLTPQIQRAVDARSEAYRESKKKPDVNRGSVLSRVFGW